MCDGVELCMEDRFVEPKWSWCSFTTHAAALYAEVLSIV